VISIGITQLSSLLKFLDPSIFLKDFRDDNTDG